MSNDLCARAWRNQFPTQSPTGTPSLPGNLVKLPAGTYGKVTVHEDGSWTVGARAYADDVDAFLAGVMRGNPTVSDELKAVRHCLLNMADARAVKRHGYSGSKAEADHQWRQL